jgi:hypothetical protein
MLLSSLPRRARRSGDFKAACRTCPDMRWVASQFVALWPALASMWKKSTKF